MHQPYRTRKYSVFDIGKEDYFDSKKNSEIMRSLDELPCAIPKEQIVIQTHLNGEIDR